MALETYRELIYDKGKDQSKTPAFFVEPFSNKLCYDSKQIRNYATSRTRSQEIGAFYQREKMNFNQHGFINKISRFQIFVGIQLRVLVYPGSALSLKFNASIKPIYQNIEQGPELYTGLEKGLAVLIAKTCGNTSLSHGFLDNYVHNIPAQIPFTHFVLNQFNKIRCLFRRKGLLFKAVFEVTL